MPTILQILAVLCFLLAYFGVSPGGYPLIALGLAFFAGSFLFAGVWPWPRRQ